MNFEANQVAMRKELEEILRRDKKFGPLHQIVMAEDDTLVLTWTDQLRPKSKSSPGPYLEFMESISDCLLNYGYCLVADEGASETEKNNYLLILPEDEFDLDDEED